MISYRILDLDIVEILLLLILGVSLSSILEAELFTIYTLPSRRLVDVLILDKDSIRSLDRVILKLSI